MPRVSNGREDKTTNVARQARAAPAARPTSGRSRPPARRVRASGTGSLGKRTESKSTTKRNPEAVVRAKERDPEALARAKERNRAPRTVGQRVRSISGRTVILLVLFAFFIVLSVSPVTMNLAGTSRLEKVQGQLKKQKAVTGSLEKDVAEAQSLDYVEEEARQQRKVAPGEILYIVTTGNPDTEVKYRVQALQSMDEAWERVRQMLHTVPRSAQDVPPAR